jgi:hypothetical protein
MKQVVSDTVLERPHLRHVRGRHAYPGELVSTQNDNHELL